MAWRFLPMEVLQEREQARGACGRWLVGVTAAERVAVCFCVQWQSFVVLVALRAPTIVPEAKSNR